MKLAALAVCTVLATPLAFATTITPGTTVASSSIGVQGTTLASVSGTLSAQTFTGSYLEYVVADQSNPYGAGDLTFVLAVSNNSGSSNGVEHISIGGGTSGFSTLSDLNVGYEAGGSPDGSDVPISIDETIYGTIEFNFTGVEAIAPGSGTDYLVVQTNATGYTSGLLSAIDSSTATVDGFIPVAVTPEPGSLALLGTGFAGGAALLRRRRKTILS